MLTCYAIAKIGDEAEYENDPSERKIPLSANLQQTGDGTIIDSDRQYQGKNAQPTKNFKACASRFSGLSRHLIESVAAWSSSQAGALLDKEREPSVE